MSYSTDPLEGFRHAGAYAAKILNGAMPGHLPIEQASKFTLVNQSEDRKGARHRRARDLAGARRRGDRIEILLRRMSPSLALRDILHVRNDEVALGVKADINGRAGLRGSVAFDPNRTWGKLRSRRAEVLFGLPLVMLVLDDACNP